MAKIFAGRIPPARLANTTYITARQSFPMAAHIKSMSFLPMDWKSLITYPLSFLVKVMLPAASTTAAATATSFDHSQDTDHSHSQATTSFHHNYSHSYRLRPQLQPSYWQLQAKPSHQLQPQP